MDFYRPSEKFALNLRYWRESSPKSSPFTNTVAAWRGVANTSP